MAVYSAAGRTTATAATANHAVFQFWNPDAAQRVLLLETGFYWAGAPPAGSPGFYMVRTTTIGTAAAVVTPDADNAWDRQDVPPSGATIRLGAFSVQPTLATPQLFGHTSAAVAGQNGTGYVWVFGHAPLTVPPGTGVAVVQRISNATPISEVYVVFEEN